MQRKRPLQREAETEDLLWLWLRGLKEKGWHFRKDATFKTFHLPFVDHEALLVVELAQEGNIIRDRLLHEAGYTVLRFARNDAQQNLESVTDTILAVLKDRA